MPIHTYPTHTHTHRDVIYIYACIYIYKYVYIYIYDSNEVFIKANKIRKNKINMENAQVLDNS